MTSMNNTIVSIASSNPQFSTLTKLLQRANLVDTLSGTGNFTVFAPTNKAFKMFRDQNPQQFTRIINDPTLLRQLLTYHALPSRVESRNITSSYLAPATVNGKTLVVYRDTNDKVRVNNATVIQPDIQTSNGVIHVVDRVLNPFNSNLF